MTTEDKQLVIQLLTEKLQKLSGKKIVFKEDHLVELTKTINKDLGLVKGLSGKILRKISPTKTEVLFQVERKEDGEIIPTKAEVHPNEIKDLKENVLKEDEFDDVANIKKAFKKAGFKIDVVIPVQSPSGRDRYKANYQTYGGIFSVSSLQNLERALSSLVGFRIEGFVPSNNLLVFYLEKS